MMLRDDIIPEKLSGRNRRLLYEWRTLEERFGGRQDIAVSVSRTNAEGLPVRYMVDYHLRSICGVENTESLGDRNVKNPPVFADRFLMEIELPANYPCVDGAPVFRFLSRDDSGNPVPHPWHPNIRYFGDMAGRVCLNADDTYTDLAWGVDRIASYLKYERYHAISEPPYPEDMQVAAWVVRQGEPQEWIFFDQD
ncbi:MAG: hypothetical protein J5835_06595 [Bacteroidales bacterium]|nr:hypothetical protein [Bacteroidales bacterium]